MFYFTRDRAADRDFFDGLVDSQGDLIAYWQLIEAGWPEAKADRWVRRHEAIFDGVHRVGRGESTDAHRWRGATLTAPSTFLSDASCACCLEIRKIDELFTTVVRPGNGGPRRVGPLLVTYRLSLPGNTTVFNDIPIVTPERTQLDLARHLDPKARAKMMRESIRLKRTTAERIAAVAKRARGVKHAAALLALAERYARLPIVRCRSDAEAYGLEALDDAGVPLPQVNHYWANEEADYCWPELKLIIEVDGPNWHLFKDEDARKTKAWRGAGYEVLRISSYDVFDHPERLIALFRLGVQRCLARTA